MDTTTRRTTHQPGAADQKKYKRQSVTISLTPDMMHVINQHISKYGLQSIGVTNTLRIILQKHAAREEFNIIKSTDTRAPRRKIIT